jgi:hypothetical protein
MATLRQQENFSDERIVAVEAKIVEWMEKWMALLG